MSIAASEIIAAVKSVTGEWTKQRKAEERNAKKKEARKEYAKKKPATTLKEVAAEILPAAYEHASGGGQYTVPQRQVYYACREEFKQRTGKTLTYKYFTGLLVEFMNDNPKLVKRWKITADPRGTFRIPNATGAQKIPCGTLAIDGYLGTIGYMPDLGDVSLTAGVSSRWPSDAPEVRYQAVLYCEKEGFDPLIEEARLAERFDVATLSCKGQSVVAARRLVDQVCKANNNCPVLIVHDFDKYGFEIARSLTRVSESARERGRVTYEFRNQVEYVDLGLRLEDVDHYGLASETCKRVKIDDDLGCTDEEREFLESGRRVELNAFTAPQLVEWLEAKLTEHTKGKRVIPSDHILKEAYKRAVAARIVRREVDRITGQALKAAADAEPPKDLRKKLLKAMGSGRGDTPWDRALAALVLLKHK